MSGLWVDLSAKQSRRFIKLDEVALSPGGTFPTLLRNDMTDFYAFHNLHFSYQIPTKLALSKLFTIAGVVTAKNGVFKRNVSKKVCKKVIIS